MAQRVPPRDKLVNLRDDRLLVWSERALLCHGEIFEERSCEVGQLAVDLGLFARRGDRASQLFLIHSDEGEAGRTREIDRHQRAVVGGSHDVSGSYQDI